MHVVEREMDVDGFRKNIYKLKNLGIMKLESLQLEKFKGNALKREQMFKLNGGTIGTPTPGGHNPNGSHAGYPASYDYSYDSDRGGVITYHGRTKVRRLVAAN